MYVDPRDLFPEKMVADGQCPENGKGRKMSLY
jgi:hypothetical protein